MSPPWTQSTSPQIERRLKRSVEVKLRLKSGLVLPILTRDWRVLFAQRRGFSFAGGPTPRGTRFPPPLTSSLCPVHLLARAARAGFLRVSVTLSLLPARGAA